MLVLIILPGTSLVVSEKITLTVSPLALYEKSWLTPEKPFLHVKMCGFLKDWSYQVSVCIFKNIFEEKKVQIVNMNILCAKYSKPYESIILINSHYTHEVQGLKKLAKGHDCYITLFAACVHGMRTKIWISLKQWFWNSVYQNYLEGLLKM